VIRVAQIKFAERTDGAEAVNVAIGNVSLPMHPAMLDRLRRAGHEGQGFGDGVVGYTATVGTDEARRAALNVIASSDFPVDGLHAQITDGGSQAMELVILGTCGPAGSDERPLLLIDPAYTNYNAFAERLGRPMVCVSRELDGAGKFQLPSMDELGSIMARTKPGAMVIIPYDNPTGQLYTPTMMRELAALAVRHDCWLVSDEAYRELHYEAIECTSVWGITEEQVPGITGRRISIETASKVWNACGLRIGALVTDNAHFHQQAVAENTASLCPSAIGQYVFGGLAHVDHADLRQWYQSQRDYYKKMLAHVAGGVRRRMPGVVVSNPDASLYSVVDVREAVEPGFDALDFVLFCATEGFVDVDGRRVTLLTAPMAGFYSVAEGHPNPGRTQMRIAYVQPPEQMAMVPRLFEELLAKYEARRKHRL
jgi:aspartate aminotransferase